MSSVNKAILIGFLGRDPEIRANQSGAKIATLSLATSEIWKDKATGERKERTQWHRVVIFNENLVKVAEQYVRKGSRLYVEGAMQTRAWTDQAKVERIVTEVVLGPFNSSLQLLDRREGGPPPAESAEQYGAPSGSDASKPGYDDEIPF